MPLYEYRCRNCSLTELSTDQDRHTITGCDHCGGTLKRVYSVNVPGPRAVFEPHYNYSVGAYVNSWSDFESKLRCRQDQQVEVTGLEHNYTPIHPADYKPANLGVSDEGLDTPRYDLSTTRTFV